MDPTEGKAEHASPDEPNTAPVKRKYKNFLLKPGLQTVLGIYSILISFLFATSIMIILYLNFSDLIESILVLTDAPDEVRDIMANYWYDSQMYVYLACLVYIVAMIGLTVWYTHRLVGPSIAFRRHILSLIAGKYYAKTNLRRGDAFEEVADALNTLSETLSDQEKERDGKSVQSEGDKS